jgi:hypothetical protein
MWNRILFTTFSWIRSDNSCFITVQNDFINRFEWFPRLSPQSECSRFYSLCEPVGFGRMKESFDPPLLIILKSVCHHFWIVIRMKYWPWRPCDERFSLGYSIVTIPSVDCLRPRLRKRSARSSINRHIVDQSVSTLFEFQLLNFSELSGTGIGRCVQLEMKWIDGFHLNSKICRWTLLAIPDILTASEAISLHISFDWIVQWMGKHARVIIPLVA